MIDNCTFYFDTNLGLARCVTLGANVWNNIVISECTMKKNDYKKLLHVSIKIVSFQMDYACRVSLCLCFSLNTSPTLCLFLSFSLSLSLSLCLCLCLYLCLCLSRSLPHTYYYTETKSFYPSLDCYISFLLLSSLVLLELAQNE